MAVINLFILKKKLFNLILNNVNNVTYYERQENECFH